MVQESLADLNGRLEEPLPMNRFRPNIVVAGGQPWEEDAWSSFEAAGASTEPPVLFASVKPCSRCKVGPHCLGHGPAKCVRVATAACHASCTLLQVDHQQ